VKINRGRIQRIAKANELFRGGLTRQEVADEMHLAVETVRKYIFESTPQDTTKTKCAGCRLEIPRRKPSEKFRGEWWCPTCFESAPSSKCEALADSEVDPIRHRVESLFETSASVPTGRHGGAR
jgi:orotate phosphoribosyltransferase-like protein